MDQPSCVDSRRPANAMSTTGSHQGREELSFFSSGKFGIYNVQCVDDPEQTSMVHSFEYAGKCIICRDDFSQILRCRKCSSKDSGGAGKLCGSCYDEIINQSAESECPNCRGGFTGQIRNDVILKDLQNNEAYSGIKIHCVSTECQDGVFLGNLENHLQSSHSEKASQYSFCGHAQEENSILQHHQFVKNFRYCTKQDGPVYKILNNNEDINNQFWALKAQGIDDNDIFHLLEFNNKLYQPPDIDMASPAGNENINTASCSASCSSLAAVTDHIAGSDPDYMNEKIDMMHADGRMRRTIYRLGAACSEEDLEKIATCISGKFDFYLRDKKQRSLSRFLLAAVRRVFSDEFTLNYLAKLFNENGLSYLTAVIDKCKKEKGERSVLTQAQHAGFPRIQNMMKNKTVLSSTAESRQLMVSLSEYLNRKPELCHALFHVVCSSMMEFSELENDKKPGQCNSFRIFDSMFAGAKSVSFLLEALDCYGEIALLHKIETWGEKNAGRF